MAPKPDNGSIAGSAGTDGSGPSPLGKRCKINRPTFRELLYKMDLVIGLKNNGEIDIMKNRYSGNTGPVKDVDQIVDVLSLLLVKNLFNNRMKVFQEGMRISIKEAIDKIIDEGRCEDDSIS